MRDKTNHIRPPFILNGRSPGSARAGMKSVFDEKGTRPCDPRKLVQDELPATRALLEVESPAFHKVARTHKGIVGITRWTRGSFQEDNGDTPDHQRDLLDSDDSLSADEDECMRFPYIEWIDEDLQHHKQNAPQTEPNPGNNPDHIAGLLRSLSFGSLPSLE